MNKKHYLQSKTLLFNVLLLPIFAIISSHTDLLRSYLSDGGYLFVLMFVSVVNAYLRCITTEGIGR